MLENIRTLAQEFFGNLQIQLDSLEVSAQDESKNIYMIKLQTPDSAILIWPFGKTLTELQHLFGQMVERKHKIHCIVHLEVNDYLESKDKKLFALIDHKIEDAQRTKRDQVIPGLSSYDRKKVHAYVSEKNIPGLRTYSVDQGEERVLHLTCAGEIDVHAAIDVDGVEI